VKVTVYAAAKKHNSANMEKVKSFFIFYGFIIIVNIKEHNLSNLQPQKYHIFK